MTVEINEPIEIVKTAKSDKDRRSEVVVHDEIEVVPEEDQGWATVLYEFTRANLENVPRVVEGSISSAERAAAYLDRLDGIISRVIRADVNCEITPEELSSIDELRADLIARKNEALSIVAATSYCKHDWKDTTGTVKRDTGHEDDPMFEGVRHETCTKCLKTRDITKTEDGERYSDSGNTYVANTCNECSTMLWKNASGENECLQCNKVMKKTATPRNNSRFVTDPFMHAIARDIINSKVSSGYSLEDGIVKAVKDWNLNEREQFLLRRTMLDMGMEVGQMIWLAPAQTTYANVQDGLTKKAIENSFVNENLESNTQRPEELLGEVERALADSGVDLDDIINSGATTREDLLDEINRRLDEVEVDRDPFDEDPKADYLEDTGFDVNPNVPPYGNNPESTDIAGDIAARLIQEMEDRTPKGPLDKFSVWKSEIRQLLNRKFEGSGQHILSSVGQEMLDKLYSGGTHPIDAAGEILRDYIDSEHDVTARDEDMDRFFDFDNSGVVTSRR